MPTTGRLSAGLLVVALTASLLPKALATNFNAAEDVDRLNREIAQRLKERGFSVLRPAEIRRTGTFYAARGDCRVVVRAATDPHAFGSRYRQVTQAAGMLQYRIADDVYAVPPLFEMWIATKLHLTKIRLGIAGPRAAALAMALSEQCPADALPTHDLLIYPEEPRRHR